jgi:hypothetical protein
MDCSPYRSLLLLLLSVVVVVVVVVVWSKEPLDSLGENHTSQYSDQAPVECKLSVSRLSYKACRTLQDLFASVAIQNLR